MIFKNCLFLRDVSILYGRDLTEKSLPEICEIYNSFSHNEIENLMDTEFNHKIYSHHDIVNITYVLVGP